MMMIMIMVMTSEIQFLFIEVLNKRPIVQLD